MKKSPPVLPPRPGAAIVSPSDSTKHPQATPDSAAPTAVEIVRSKKKADLYQRKGPRGARWYARVRRKDHREMKSFATRSEAEEWKRDRETAIANAKTPFGLGPRQTTLAVALLEYAHMYSTHKKGVLQEVLRINRYLEAAGLPVLRIARHADGQVELKEEAASSKLPEAFARQHREQIRQRPKTIALRAELALTPMSKVTAHALRGLSNAMRAEGLSNDTIRLEFALLRHLFNRAREEWHWVTLENPLQGFRLPSPGKPRDRRLSTEESERLEAALAECRNPWMRPYVHLAIETAMRRSEMLLGSTWSDVHLDKRHLLLRDTKNGESRLVPLTKRAVDIVGALPRQPEEARVFPMNANELTCAWKRVLKRAGIVNLRIHDLRHEAASRHATRLQGDIFKLCKITGHKSVKMLERYVNPGFDELIAQLDATEPPAPDGTPAQASANVIPFSPATRPGKAGASPLDVPKTRPA